MKNKKVLRHEARASFYIHLIIFAIVNSLLVGINLRFTPDVLWVLFILLGWGSGLFIHGLTAFWGLESDAEPNVNSHNIKGRAVPV